MTVTVDIINYINDNREDIYNEIIDFNIRLSNSTKLDDYLDRCYIKEVANFKAHHVLEKDEYLRLLDNGNILQEHLEMATTKLTNYQQDIVDLSSANTGYVEFWLYQVNDTIDTFSSNVIKRDVYITNLSGKVTIFKIASDVVYNLEEGDILFVNKEEEFLMQIHEPSNILLVVSEELDEYRYL